MCRANAITCPAACARLWALTRSSRTLPAERQLALMQALLNHTDALMQQGQPLPRRLARHPGKGNWLSALELQLVWQGGWRIGQKTRRLGAAAITRRPTLHAGDWGLIAMRTLGRQMPSRPSRAARQD